MKAVEVTHDSLHLRWALRVQYTYNIFCPNTLPYLRDGVVTSEMLTPAWRDLLVSPRRMEVRGGRFGEAYLGEQLALQEALNPPRGPAAESGSAGRLNLRVIPLHRPRIVAPVKLQLVS